MFLYSDKGLFDKAYLITPDENGDFIQHQYNCVCCTQFEIIGFIEPINESLASILVETLGCEPMNISVARLKTKLDIKSILGEGLLLLQDGRYIAVENCD